MCGRFYVPEPSDSPEALAELLRTLREKQMYARSPLQVTCGEIRPGDAAAVLAPDTRRRPSVFAMRWGFCMEKHTDPLAPIQLAMEEIATPSSPSGRLVFNARSETAASRALFADSMRDRRCLIPAAAYFEWDHYADKQKYAFQSTDSDTLWLAGLYRREQDGTHFTILTREAAGGVERFHHRMPVIMPGHLMYDWLDRSAPPQQLLAYAVTDLQWKPV